jgi:hypothetical protein
MQKHIGDQILKLINAIRNETGEFMAEINGPKEGEARDKMIRALLQQANHAESMLFDRLLAAEPSPSPDDEIGDLHGILDPADPGCGAVLPNHLA